MIAGVWVEVFNPPSPLIVEDIYLPNPSARSKIGHNVNFLVELS